jgi:AraC-like DNA-binding protein
VNSEWTFEVVTECQRFVCAAIMEGTLDDGPRMAAALRVTIPSAPDPSAAQFLRATLFEIAMRWGAEQHRRLAQRCPRRPCTITALAEPGRFWPSHARGSDVADSFVAHMTAMRDELARTHATSLAQRAAAMFRESGGKTTVESAARALGTHPSTLRRAFRKEAGMTPREYLARVRLARAEALLMDAPDVKVEPVAYAVGWASKSGLYRAFRRFRAETPGGARNVCRQAATSDARRDRAPAPAIRC